jgi:hypothetical protein
MTVNTLLVLISLLLLLQHLTMTKTRRRRRELKPSKPQRDAAEEMLSSRKYRFASEL